jgi:hypothetical protein
MAVFLHHYYPNTLTLALCAVFAIGFLHKTVIHILQAGQAILKLAKVGNIQL